VSRLAVLPLGLVQGAILARQLQPAGLGRYSAILVDVNLLVTLVSLGLPGALAVLMGERNGRLRALLRFSIGFLLVCFALPGALLSALALSLPEAPLYLRRLPGEVVLIAALCTLQFFRDVLNSLLSGGQQFQAQNIQALFLGVFQLALYVGLYAMGRLTPQTALLIQLASHGVLCMMAAQALRRFARDASLWQAEAPEPGLARRAVSIGSRNFLHILMGLLLMRVDVKLMEALLPAQTGNSELGLYQVGVRLAEMVLMVPSALNAVLFAKAAAQEDLRAVTVAGAKLSLYLGLLCLVGMALVGQPFLTLIYGARFSGSFVPCLLVLSGCCVLCFSSPLAGTVAGDGAYPRSVIIAEAVALLTNVGANLYLIPAYGATGAAAASTLAYGVSAAILSGAFASRFNVSWRELLRVESPVALVRRVRGA
jgi:O-antigen/teichoic acid export membrane protein